MKPINIGVPRYNQQQIDFYENGATAPTEFLTLNINPNGMAFYGNNLFVAGSGTGILWYKGVSFSPYNINTISPVQLNTGAGSTTFQVIVDLLGNVYASNDNGTITKFIRDNATGQYSAGNSVSIQFGAGGDLIVAMAIDYTTQTFWATNYSTDTVCVCYLSNFTAANQNASVIKNIQTTKTISTTNEGQQSVFGEMEGLALNQNGIFISSNWRKDGTGVLSQISATAVTSIIKELAASNYNLLVLNDSDVNIIPITGGVQLGGLCYDKYYTQLMYVNNQAPDGDNNTVTTLVSFDPANPNTQHTTSFQQQNPGNGEMAFMPPSLMDSTYKDVYIRDNFDDTGAEPYTGTVLSQSPDICHFDHELDATELANLSNQATTDSTGIIIGDNFIYARLTNIETVPQDAVVKLYYIEPAAFMTPTGWNAVDGEIIIPNIPSGFTVSAPLVWDTSALNFQAGDHKCFVALVGTDFKPMPDFSMIKTLQDYNDFIAGHNTIAWKNFDVVNAVAGHVVGMSVTVNGWNIKDINSDLEIDLHTLPANTNTEMKILSRIVADAELNGMSKISETQTQSTYSLSTGIIASINNLSLKKNDSTEMDLSITLPTDLPNGVYDVSVIQKVDGTEMGRVTRRINVGQFPYIGNKRSMEVHESNCPWIPEMDNKNKLFFTNVDTALAQKFDGCYTCLPEYNHG